MSHPHRQEAHPSKKKDKKHKKVVIVETPTRHSLKDEQPERKISETKVPENLSVGDEVKKNEPISESVAFEHNGPQDAGSQENTISILKTSESWLKKHGTLRDGRKWWTWTSKNIDKILYKDKEQRIKRKTLFINESMNEESEAHALDYELNETIIMRDQITQTRNSLGLDKQEDTPRWILEENPFWVEVGDAITADHDRGLIIQTPMLSRPSQWNVPKQNENGKGNKKWAWNRSTDNYIIGPDGRLQSRKRKRKKVNKMRPVISDVVIRPWEDLAWRMVSTHWITPITTVTEGINECFTAFLRKVRNALDVLTLPYSYNGQVISRLKGCLWTMSRTSRILQRPDVNVPRQDKVKAMLNKSFPIFEHSVVTLLVECRASLDELIRSRKLFKRYKSIFKGLDDDMYLWLVDEDNIEDTLHFATPYYASNRMPVDPMIWENFPTWEKVPDITCDFEPEDPPDQNPKAGYHYYQLLVEKPSFDFLWLPKDQCYLKGSEETDWYDYDKLDHDLRIDVMNMIHKSARDILVVSKRTFFEANHLIKKRPAVDEHQQVLGDCSIVDGLWFVMKREIKNLWKVKTHRTDYLRIHRFQIAIQAFYVNLDHIEHLICLLKYAVNWLNKHYRLVHPLAFCMTDSEANNVLRRRCICLSHPLKQRVNFFCKRPEFQRVRFPMTHEERTEFQSLLQSQWKDSLAAERNLRRIIVCCGGVYIRGWPFKKKRPSHPFIWAWKKMWQIEDGSFSEEGS